MVLKGATFFRGANENGNGNMHPSFYDSLREISPKILNRENLNLFEIGIYCLRLKGLACRELSDGSIASKSINTRVVQKIVFPDAANANCARAVLDSGSEFDFVLSSECMDVLNVLAQL